jgi:hypothetical protein
MEDQGIRERSRKISLPNDLGDCRCLGPMLSGVDIRALRHFPIAGEFTFRMHISRKWNV